MSNETFKQLLADMPEVARVVNTFENPEVQRLAFVAFVRALMRPGDFNPKISAARKKAQAAAVKLEDDKPMDELLDTSAIDDGEEESTGESIHSFINAG